MKESSSIALWKEMKVCTISKYPPYMSGHAFEALYHFYAT
jgi:hypothetical protein